MLIMPVGWVCFRQHACELLDMRCISGVPKAGGLIVPFILMNLHLKHNYFHVKCFLVPPSFTDSERVECWCRCKQLLRKEYLACA